MAFCLPRLLCYRLLVCTSLGQECLSKPSGVQAYWGVLLLIGSVQGSLYLNQALAASVELPAVLLTLFLLERIGRQPIFCFALLQGKSHHCGAKAMPGCFRTAGVLCADWPSCSQA